MGLVALSRTDSEIIVIDILIDLNAPNMSMYLAKNRALKQVPSPKAEEASMTSGTDEPKDIATTGAIGPSIKEFDPMIPIQKVKTYAVMGISSCFFLSRLVGVAILFILCNT